MKPLFAISRLQFAIPCSLLAVLLFASCSNKYNIDGTSSVTSLDGKLLSLRTMTENGEWIVVDSAGVEHGSFKMSGEVDSVIMVMLCLNDDAIMPVILERGHMKLSISNADARVSGTPLNNALYEFIDRRNELQSRLNELERRETQLILEGGNYDEIQAEIAAEAKTLSEEASTQVKSFITDNYENILGPSVFVMLYGSLPYPIMTEQIEDIMRTAPMSFKENVFVKNYLSTAKENMKRIEEQRKLEESSRATANAALK